MLGDLLGKVLGAPLRVASIPTRILESAADKAIGDDVPIVQDVCGAVSDVLEGTAEAVEEGTKEALGE